MRNVQPHLQTSNEKRLKVKSKPEDEFQWKSFVPYPPTVETYYVHAFPLTSEGEYEKRPTYVKWYCNGYSKKIEYQRTNAIW